MLKAIFAVLFISASLSFKCLVDQEPPESSLDLSNCEPQGFITKIYAKVAPLRFWTNQVPELEKLLIHKKSLAFINQCRADFAEDQQKIAQCLNALENDKSGKGMYLARQTPM